MKRPELSDIRDLLRFYGVGDDERRELEELARLARLARQRAWWRDYPDVFGDSEFAGFEADAARICCYLPLILPGLLQTAAYTEAYMDVGAHPPQWRTRAQEARQRRQMILNRDDGTAPDLVAVVPEAALLYRWGTPEDHRRQREHLLAMSRPPNVELRLLRFDAGMQQGMCGPINIFHFPGAEPPIVYLETDFAIREVSNLDEVAAYIDIFERVRQAALDQSATTAYLATPVPRLGWPEGDQAYGNVG